MQEVFSAAEVSVQSHVRSSVVRDPARLAAVRASGLLDTEIEEAFDRLTRLAVQLVGVASAFISLVDENRDFYKSSCGFAEPLASAREMSGPTFCHYTIESDRPLVIPDTNADPRYRDAPTVKSLGVAAYVGIPLVYSGQVIGSFCAIELVPRDWTPRDVAALADLASIALSEIELRSATRRSEEARRQLADANRQLEQKRLELATANESLQANAIELEAQAAALVDQAQAARSDHLRISTILSSISDAFFALDHDWRFTYVNDRAEQVLLRPRDELLGRSLWDEFPAAAGSTFEVQYRRAITSGSAVSFEEYYGPLRIWFEVRAYPSANGLSVYFQDVTSRRAADAQREEVRQRAEAAEAAASAANAAKGDFLATMSHELRTPLNAILGYTNLLELEITGAVNAGQRAHLARLRASAEHLLALVNDVLDLSKLEAGEMALASDVGSATVAVEAAFTLAAPAAAARNIELLHAAEEHDAAAYVGDEMRVRQILVNLVSNAVKFTEPGGEVRISTSRVLAPPEHARLAGEGPWASIAVRDTGIGVPPEYQAAVFQPFKQVVSGHTRTRGGTGLGLAISRRLARQMGGEITLESAAGAGSTFTLWLPAAGTSDGVTESGAQRSARARRNAPGHRVHGLGEIGHRLRDDVEGILAAVVTRIRTHPDFQSAPSLGQADLEDHTLSFLANAVQSLVIVDQTGGIESDLMNDGARIQQFIARSHGAQRWRLGFTEQLVAQEYGFIDEELAGRIRTLGIRHPDDATLAIGIVARLVVHARDASIQGFRHARTANDTSQLTEPAA